MLIDIIAGARPNFMKVAPIINEIKSRQSSGSLLKYRLVHTGQHYDTKLSKIFFEQLRLPIPDINLKVGSGTQAEQASRIMVRYEKLLLASPCSLCLVVGDVNSTMACSIVARKMNCLVAHVEAGIRSGDWSMPEEVNRVITDSISNWFFTTSEFANNNLRKSGVDRKNIFFVGNTMIDTLFANLNFLKKPKFFDQMKLKPHEYLVLTLHRPNNVDTKEKLIEFINVIATSSGGMPIVFAVHPRTTKVLGKNPDVPPNIILVAPQPYLQFLFLVKNARAVVTDSGGLTEEATVLGVPCMTLRDSTERPETVAVGTNELLGTSPEAITPALNKLFSGKWKKGKIPKKWDGNSGKRIVNQLERLIK